LPQPVAVPAVYLNIEYFFRCGFSLSVEMVASSRLQQAVHTNREMKSRLLIRDDE
jgi:hypothetical protein